MRLLVAIEGEVTMRAAQSLHVHPGVETVALLGPSKAPGFDTVDSAAGFDAVFGAKTAAGTARTFGMPAVVIGGLEGQPGIAGASVVGLALALAAAEGPDALVAVAVPGEVTGDRRVVFPSPLDGRAATAERHGGREVLVARDQAPLGAAMVMGETRHRVILDDHRFLEGVALAAAVALLPEIQGEPLPVWARPGPYLRTAAEMGLVVAERPAAA